MNLDDNEIKSLMRASNGLTKWNNDRIKKFMDDLDLFSANLTKMKLDFEVLKNYQKSNEEYLEILKPFLKEMQSKETKERIKNEKY